MWAGVENYFDTLKKDLDLIYYASYFCELASYLTRENNDELEILKITLSDTACIRKKRRLILNWSAVFMRLRSLHYMESESKHPDV